jgi:hypothetical protein
VHAQIPRHSKGLRSYGIRATKTDRDADLWPFIQTVLDTSLNKDIEVLSIQVKHIDLAKQIICIPKAKVSAREQHITARLTDFLEERMKSLEAGQEFLFPVKKSYRQHRSYMVEPFK